MRHTFLISTAAAALVAGTVFAAAQGAQKQAPAGGATERSAPSQGEVQRGSDQTQGERSQGREESQPRERRGQAQGERREQGQPKTTGQGEGKQQSQGQAQPRQQEQSQPKTTDQGQSKQNQGQAQPGQGERREGAAKQEQSGKSSVSFTTEQRTKIRETVLRGGNAPRVSNVNFSIKVGTAVPTTVHVVTVPDLIVEVHPEWRGHLYFVYNDEIIIVDKNHHIVAIIEV